MVNPENTNEMDQFHSTLNAFRKFYRTEQHLHFLNNCILHEITPLFCRIPDRVNSQTLLSPTEKLNLENRKLHNELEIQNQQALIFKNQYNFHKNLIFKNIDCPANFSGLIKNLENRVKNSEKKKDLKRDRKLTKLISEKLPYYTKTQIINLTNISIPPEIKNLLESGPNNPIGGHVRHEGSETFLGLDTLASTSFL